MRQMITITDGNGTILAKIPTDADEVRRTLTIERDGTPVYGLEITKDGTVVVGYWINDEQWKTLHTDTAKES